MGMSRNELRYEWWKTRMFTNPSLVAQVLAPCTNQAEVDAAIDVELFKAYEGIPVEADEQIRFEKEVEQALGIRRLPGLSVDAEVMTRIEKAAEACGIIPKAQIRAILSDWAYHRN